MGKGRRRRRKERQKCCVNSFKKHRLGANGLSYQLQELKFVGLVS